MRRSLTLSIDVGEIEIHHVACEWHQGFGQVRVLVDGQEELRRREFASLDTTTEYAVEMGTVERHSVVFRKTRPRLLAGIRQQTLDAIVDGTLAAGA